MDPTLAKTPEQIADEAKRVARDAALAAQGIAAEAHDIGRSAAHSIRTDLRDASVTAQEALDTAKGLAGDAKEIAGDAAVTGRAYAAGAANAAARKLDNLKGKANDLKVKGERYVADEPVRAVLWAIAGGAVLTSLLLSMVRRRRYDD